MKNIKTIILDLGGVLMDLDKQKCIEAFEDLGFSDITEFRDKIRKHIGKAITDQQIDEAFNRFLVGIPEQKLTLLRQLRKTYRIFMLSNTNPIMFESRIPELFRIQGLNISDYFDKLYLSYQLGATKPAPEIFEKIIADSGVLPQETMFLDDSQRNIDAARKLGFQTYLVAPREDFSFIFGL